jgi:hypothetical protein
LLWWGWLVICALPISPLGPGGAHSFVEAIAVVRFPIFAAAVEHWVLRDVAAPAAAALLGRRRTVCTLATYALLLGSVGMMVLIGQRMPLTLTGFGLLVVGVLLPGLRPVVLAAALAGIGFLGAVAVVSPPTYARVVLQFLALLRHFPTSPYGEIYARSWHIAAARPWFGRGFDGFRTGCLLPQYFGPTSAVAFRMAAVTRSAPRIRTISTSRLWPRAGSQVLCCSWPRHSPGWRRWPADCGANRYRCALLYSPRC